LETATVPAIGAGEVGADIIRLTNIMMTPEKAAKNVMFRFDPLSTAELMLEETSIPLG
jgi:hypothetical protein